VCCGKEAFSPAFHAVFYDLGSKIALKNALFALGPVQIPCKTGLAACLRDESASAENSAAMA
jgi:hypothetical protein